MNSTKNRNEALRKAIIEAEEFINRSTSLLIATNSEPTLSHPKKSSAVRRQSMELTRALAEYREW